MNNLIIKVNRNIGHIKDPYNFYWLPPDDECVCPIKVLWLIKDERLDHKTMPRRCGCKQQKFTHLQIRNRIEYVVVLEFVLLSIKLID